MSQLTLGKLIKLLEVEKQDDKCVFDFCSFYPSDLDSWRGVYAHLAFNYEDGRDKYDELPTVADILKMCREALGATFHGYKGGDFKMDYHTPLWVSSYGKSEYTAVVGVSSNGYGTTYIDTAYMEYNG